LATTAEVPGLLFVLLPNGRILLFHGGERILVRRARAWHLQPASFRSGIRILAKQQDLPPEIFEDVIRMSIAVSDSQQGCLLTVGKHEAVQELADPLIATAVDNLPYIGAETALNLLTQDGATIVAANGQIVEAGCALRPDFSASIDFPPGSGSRHRVAYLVSKQTGAVCVVVSSSGLITCLARGELVFKVMG
jgi:DNA integrity scanning protein DisA with diadenylate cyclase activity